MAGPEVPFPWSVTIRYADRLFRLPVAQRPHVIAKAKERIASGRHSKRDRVFATLAITRVGNG